MTNEVALKLLGLTESPSVEEVRDAFRSRYAEVERLRLSSTEPVQQARFEEMGRRLTQSRDILLAILSSPLSETQLRDLPLCAPRMTTEAGITRGHVPSGGEPSIGQVLVERFELRRRLGSGGMGVVFAAFDRVLEQEIAVKMLLPHLLNDPQSVKRFLTEVKIASTLTHPQIVRVYEVYQAPEGTFLTMELLHGRSLREEIFRRSKAERRFSIQEVQGIGMQLCKALEVAHQHTVHRDVKPENIWLNEDGSVKLLDFGIARLLRPSQFESNGMVLGTACYMAPEQIQGRTDVDHKADQFAVGVVLYEILTGKLPLGVIKPPHEIHKNLSLDLSRALMQAMAGEPKDRHADMKTLADRLSGMRRPVSRWLLTAAVVSLILGGSASIPLWHRWLNETSAEKTAPDLSVASTKLPPPTQEPVSKEAVPERQVKMTAPERSQVEDQALRVKFSSELAKVVNLQTKAENMEKEIASKVTKCHEALANLSDKPDRERLAREELEQAERRRDLWNQHPQKVTWDSDAVGALAAAKVLADDRAFPAALVELKKAEKALQVPYNWPENAQLTLQLRYKVIKHIDGVPANDRVVFSWPDKLVRDAESQLLVGDGVDGKALAQKASDWIADGDRLLTRRRDIAALRTELRTVEPLPFLGQTSLSLEKNMFGRYATHFDGDSAAQKGQAYEALQLYATEENTITLQLVGALLRRGEQYSANNDFLKAIEDYNRAIRLDKKKSEAFKLRAWAYEQQKNDDRAINDFNEAVRLDDGNASNYAWRGDFYGTKKDYDKAIADYDKAISLSPDYSWAYRRRGDALSSRDNESGPLKLVEFKVVQGKWIPDDTDVDKAIKDYTEAIRLNPKDDKAFLGRGQVHYRTKKYDNAIEDFGKAISLSPDYSWAYRLRGDAFMSRNNPGSDLRLRGKLIFPADVVKAIVDYTEAIRLNPKDDKAFLARGRAYTQQKDNESANKDYDEAARLGNFEARLLRGDFKFEVKPLFKLPK